MVLRNGLLPSVSRLSPFIVYSYIILNAMINYNVKSVYLIIIFILTLPLNWILKHVIMKPIYNILKVKSLPLLGIGSRPPNAISCGLYLDNLPSSSFGMPSGHSQIIWTFGIYLL